MKSRTVKYRCGICEGRDPFEVKVPYGHFIQTRGDNVINYSVEIMKERPGLADIPFKMIVCPNCGCMNQLKLVSENA